MIVWEGTFTDRHGLVFDATIRIDADKLAASFNGRAGNRPFRRAQRDGTAKATRCRGGVIVDLEFRGQSPSFPRRETRQ